MGEKNNYFKNIKPAMSPPRKPVIPYSPPILKTSLPIVNLFATDNWHCQRLRLHLNLHEEAWLRPDLLYSGKNLIMGRIAIIFSQDRHDSLTRQHAFLPR